MGTGQLATLLKDGGAAVAGTPHLLICPIVQARFYSNAYSRSHCAIRPPCHQYRVGRKSGGCHSRRPAPPPPPPPPLVSLPLSLSLPPPPSPPPSFRVRCAALCLPRQVCRESSALAALKGA